MISNQSVWPKSWHDMTVEQRVDDLLLRMLRMPPKKQSEYVGISLKIPRPKKRPNPKPLGYMPVPDSSLLARISAAIPNGRPDLRDEMIQDLALAIVSGEIGEEVLEDLGAISKLRNKVLAKYANHWSVVSLDAQVGRDSNGLRWKDVLSDGESIEDYWIENEPATPG